MILKIIIVVIIVVIGVCIVSVGITSDNKHYNDTHKRNEKK